MAEYKVFNVLSEGPSSEKRRAFARSVRPRISHIGSTPTAQPFYTNFDLYFNTAYAAHNGYYYNYMALFNKSKYKMFNTYCLRSTTFIALFVFNKVKVSAQKQSNSGY